MQVKGMRFAALRNDTTTNAGKYHFMEGDSIEKLLEYLLILPLLYKMLIWLVSVAVNAH